MEKQKTIKSSDKRLFLIATQPIFWKISGII